MSFQEYSSSSEESDVESNYNDIKTKINISAPYIPSSAANNSNNRSDLAEKEKIVDRYQKLVNNDKVKTVKTTNDRANRATVDNVLDPRTIRFIKKIFNNGLITEMNGSISTGKEANVYHAYNNETHKEYAVKIYKTSILVFKDRERYVDGEFRFRHTKRQHNPRKMIKLWAEKEFRNLKRLYLNGMPVPEPVDLKSHVLVMEYLTQGNGEPSPKLKDYAFKSLEQLIFFYHRMVYLMRQMFQVCKLVHADLSEYNSIIHEEQLYIIDVSQSVEPDHPMSLDFLRMDIKNVNDYFQREGVPVHPERMIFKFVIDHDITSFGIPKSALDDDLLLEQELMAYLSRLETKSADYKDGIEDEVFRSIHLVRSLNHLEEKDFEEYAEGNISTLQQLSLDVAPDAVGISDDETDTDDADTDTEGDERSDDDDDDETDDEGKVWVEKDKILRGKKHEDKNDKKDRKKEAKEQAKEKRKTKMKKHVKKKLVNKGKK